MEIVRAKVDSVQDEAVEWSEFTMTDVLRIYEIESNSESRVDFQEQFTRLSVVSYLSGGRFYTEVACE